MYIRKYTFIVIILIFLSLILSITGYQYMHTKNNVKEMEEVNGNYRFASIKDNKIEIYSQDKWQEFQVRGVEISAFTPGHSRNKTRIKKKVLMNWLKEISDLNANVIKITGIQEPSFYNAIYDYNKNAENPIYTIHEIELDEREILKNHDIYDEGLIRRFKKDIEKTIDIIHGRSFLLRSKRNHSGLYLKDISNYNLGYIIGVNTSPEIISLNNLKYPEIDSYEGRYVSLEKGSSFETFAARMLDFATSYEIKKYRQISLFSYLTTVETDPIEYRYEPKITRDASFNMDSIKSDIHDNLFVAYKYHPNSPGFLDYEYENLDNGFKTDYNRQLERINIFYKKPVLISDTGISSSRSASKVDLRDGFNRGGFSEKQQGRKLINLLDSIDISGLAGSIVTSWQDDWTRITGGADLLDGRDKNISAFWYNAQASDEAFGLIAFEKEKKNKNIYLDGNIEEWENIDYIIDDEIKVKLRSESSHLYVMLEKSDLDFEKEDIYLGIDITDKSGSDYWVEKEAKFDIPVDFIIHFNGYANTRVLVHERYNKFDFSYKYYSPVVDRKNEIPNIDSNRFSPIYTLNRRKFYLKEKDKIIPAIYKETGKLREGNDNPSYNNFNSLADYKVSGNHIEIKIPWDMINVKNPIEMDIYDDFYLEGLEKSLKNNSIDLSLYDGLEDRTYTSKKVHKLEKRKSSIDYNYRLKKSYFILKDYWSDRK